MQQVYWIKSSQTWTCPKTGAWKIICVGGGSSGGLGFSHNGIQSTIINNGGTTSFGSILSANGGVNVFKPVGIYSSITAYGVGGYGGYDGVNYGGVPQSCFSNVNIGITASNATLNGGHYYTPGGGFGAGGASSRVPIKALSSAGNESSLTGFPLPGMCGEMAMIIYDINQETGITCTIGQGGNIPVYNNSVKSLLTSAGFSGYPTSANGQNIDGISAGKSGVIYLEYLG